MSNWRSHFSAKELEELDYVRLMYPSVDKLLNDADRPISDVFVVSPKTRENIYNFFSGRDQGSVYLGRPLADYVEDDDDQS